MSKFAIVKRLPTDISSGTLALSYPDFLEEIRDSKLRVAKGNTTKLTKNNMLRNALVLISMRMTLDVGIPSFNAFKIPLVNYEGLPYKTEKDISDLLVRIIEKHVPHVIDIAITRSVNARPQNTQMILFNGPEDKAALLIGLGFVKGKAPKALTEEIPTVSEDTETLETNKEDQV
jgi:hypothetical protein